MDDTARLPLEHLRYALRHARQFQMEHKPYPGPTGKRIADILVVGSYPTGDLTSFDIIFEDNTARWFVVGEEA